MSFVFLSVGCFFLYFLPTASAQGMVNLGLVGEWNSSHGEFRAVALYKTRESGGIKADYAYCTTSEGLVIFNININKVSLASFISLGECYGLEIETINNERTDYMYITKGEAGLEIVKVEVDDPKKLYYLANCDTPGSAQEVAIEGNYAYVADGESGLQIIDISDRHNPKIIGSCDTPSFAHDVAIEGNYAYVADGEGGLQIIDISDRHNPEIRGSWDTLDDTQGVVIAENYAYLADGWSGLQIIDISNPDIPVIVGSYDTRGSAKAITIAGNYVYVDDLFIIDISGIRNKKGPVIVGSCDAGGNSIAIADNYAYVVDDHGLAVVDISHKNGPVIFGSWATAGSGSWGVVIEGDYAYVADGWSGLQIIDISDPNIPVIVGSCITPYNAQDVAIGGSYAYVADGDSGLQIVNISDPNDPVIIGSWDTPYDAQGVAIAENYAYVADGQSGLQIIDISNPNIPVIMGSCDTPDDAQGVTIADNYAYVADGRSGLQIIDISNPNIPVIVGNCDTPSFAYDVAIADNYAYVADGVSGLHMDERGSLQIIDISNPNIPVIVGSCDDILYDARGVAIAENYAYVANNLGGLQIVDISNPSDPVIIGSHHFDSFLDVDIKAGYAYVAEWNGGLGIVDISHKNGPVIVGSSNNVCVPMAVAIEDGFAYVANGYCGLDIIDISNKNGPVIVGSFDTPSFAYGVAVANNYAYVTDRDSGLHIVDISDPASPVIVGSCNTPHDAQGVAIADNHAYVADGDSGLQIIDISNPNIPVIVGGCDTPGTALNVAVDSNYAYVADGGRGLLIVNISDPNIPIVGRMGSDESPYSASDVAIVDSNYACGVDEGLQLIDIRNKSEPVIVGSCDTPEFASSVFIVDNYAYVTDTFGSLYIIDISHRNNPMIVGTYDVPGFTYDVAVKGNCAYMIDDENLMQLKINIAPSRKGDLILAAGGSRDNKNTYWSGTQTIGNQIFSTFRTQSYEVYDIYYLNSAYLQDIDNDGFPNQLVVDDPVPSVNGLEYAITDWAVNDSFNTGPLYISLVGHGAEDRFQIMPNEVITASELKSYINTFKATKRPVVVFLESADSGSFIDDLAYDPNYSDNDDTIVITSTGLGPSYLKPSPDPNTNIPISFTNLFMANFQIPSNPADYQNFLKDAFISARNLLYDQGPPFLDQAPQMYLPKGPIALTLHLYNPNIAYDPNLPYDPNIPLDPLIITSKAVFLHAIAKYPDGNAVILDPASFRFLSSNPLVFEPKDPNQREIIGDQICIRPAKNGLTTLIAYPDPQLYPNILLTARLPIEVAIPDNPAAGGNKAIIVAGYKSIGEMPGLPDNLWENTNTIANHAYWSLHKKGYGREDIFYLNPYFLQDVDRNGQRDDIDDHPTLSNLDQALAEIKETGAQELMIFLVDHGAPGTFNLNPCCNGLTVQDLAKRIGSLSSDVKNQITILVDACHSGSFIQPVQDELKSLMDPNKVIIITSTDPNKPNQLAYLEAEGMNSFSYFFFDQFLLTNSLQDSFDHACSSISAFPQDPGFFNQSLAKERDRELTYYIDEPKPAITQREFSREGGKLKIRAEVYSLVGIDRVWVLITSSERDSSIVEVEPKTNAPIYNLKAVDLNAPYGGWYETEIDDPYPDAFNYQIVLSAKDKTDKVTTDRTNISSLETDEIGAIILATNFEGLEEDKAREYSNTQSVTAYNVLKQKEIQDKNIYYLKDRGPTFRTITQDIPSWVRGKDYRLLLIYLTGQGGLDNGEKAYFSLNQDPNQKLYPRHITEHIDPNCHVVFLYDAPFGQEFMKEFMDEFYLNPKPGWVGITDPCIDPNYPLFFSKFFSSILASRSIGNAFLDAYKFANCLNKPPSSSYLYTRDFDPSNFQTIREMLGLSLGRPTANNDSRLIQEVQATEEESLITVKLKIKESVKIDPPLAVFLTPTGGGSAYKILTQVTQDAPSLWSCSLPQVKDHPYFEVSISARQIDPEMTDAETCPIIPTRVVEPQPDTYEQDNTLGEAKQISINTVQEHTFHSLTDIDWVYFFGYKGHSYEIDAQDTSGCALFIQLSLSDPNERAICDPNGKAIPNGSGYGSLSFKCLRDSYYYLKLERASDPNEGEINYNLLVKDSQAVQLAAIIGRVVNQDGEGVNGVRIQFFPSQGGPIFSSLGNPMPPALTGSLKKVQDNTLDQTMTEGWYFLTTKIGGGMHELRITEKVDPNIILKQISGIFLYPGQINRMPDITLAIPGVPGVPGTSGVPGYETDAASGFRDIYSQWGGTYYPLNADTDHDGLSNMEEFLYGTDPNLSSFKCLLYQGVNLFPFSSQAPCDAVSFCSNTLGEGDSIWKYNKGNSTWNRIGKSDGRCGGSDFDLMSCDAYLFYYGNHHKVIPQVILQDKLVCQEPDPIPGLNLIPGLSLITISEPKGQRGGYEEQKEEYTSLEYLQKSKSKNVLSISRYKPKNGKWDSSCWFFGQPEGNFSILPSEAYITMIGK